MKTFSETELKAIKQARELGETDGYIAWMFGCEVSELPKKTAKKEGDKDGKKT